MDKFRHISTELWPLIDVINWFFTILGISLPIFFKLCMKRSSFKMIFLALKISRGGVCCMPAALLFNYGLSSSGLKSGVISEIQAFGKECTVKFIFLISQQNHMLWILIWIQRV